jgi:hypothetical protein
MAQGPSNPLPPDPSGTPELDAMRGLLSPPEAAEDSAEMPATAVCPNCQVPYPILSDDRARPLVRYMCGNCRYPLLGRDLDDNEAVPLPTERILHLFGACEKVANGEWTAEEFQGFMTEVFIPQLLEKEQGIRNFEIPFGLEQDFALEFEVGTRGVDLCNEALLRLLAVDQEDAGRIEAMRGALDHFFKGICNVKEAMRINRDNRDRPLWI